MLIAPSMPLTLPSTAGLYIHGADLVALDLLERLRPQLRREVDQIVGHLERVARIGRRLGRERLRRARLLAGHVGLRHRPLLDRPHRLAGHAIEDEQERLLAGDGDRLDRAAVDGDVGQNRRRRHVVVPERMVHELEVPLPLAGLQIDADEALGKQVVARADGRRRSPRSASRPAGRPGRAPRRR